MESKVNQDLKEIIARETALYKSARRLQVALTIRNKMFEKGLRNVDIAQRLGVSEANVSRWLRGTQNLSIDTIYSLVDALQARFAFSIDGLESTSDACQGGVEDSVREAVEECWDVTDFESVISGGNVRSLAAYAALKNGSSLDSSWKNRHDHLPLNSANSAEARYECA